MLKKFILFLPLIAIIAGVGAVVVLGRSPEPEVTVEQLQANPDSFVTLSEYNADPNRFEGKRTVYFFHAVWCPTCRTLENDIKRNLGSIPEDVVIVKTDFDSQEELKEQYGVITQHTLVQVSADGSILGKWLGQPSLRNVLSNLQSV